MYIVISYDISDDDRRTRVAKVLLGYGRRVQMSVYECVLDERLYLKMKARVERLIDQAEDSVRFYTLCRRCVGAIEICGQGTVTQDGADAVVIV